MVSLVVRAILATGIFEQSPSPSAPVNTAAPTITGSPRVGSPTMSSPGTWTGYPAPTYTYQWRIATTSGGTYADISGATSSTYTPVSADEGKFLKVRVTAANASGSPYADSAYSGPVGEEVAVVAGAMRYGANVYGNSYWRPNNHLINWVLEGDDRWWGGIPDAQISPDVWGWGGSAKVGHICNLKKNDSVTLSVKSGSSPEGPYHEGPMVAKLATTAYNSVAGKDLQISVTGTGLTSITRDTNHRVTFTVADGTKAFGITIVNLGNPDVVIHRQNAVVCRAEYESLYDAGKLFQPEFLADSQHYDHLRFLDCLSVNGTDIVDVASLTTMETGPNSVASWPIEYAIIACKELGADPWINLPLPAAGDMYAWVPYAGNRLRLVKNIYDGANVAACPSVDAFPWSEGDVVYFFSDEVPDVFKLGASPFTPTGWNASSESRCFPMYVRNVSGATFQVSLTPEGSILEFDYTFDFDYWPDYKGPEDAYDVRWHLDIVRYHPIQPIFEAYADRIHAVWPDCPRLFIEAGNETWNGGYPFSIGMNWAGIVGYNKGTGGYKCRWDETVPFGLAYATRMAMQAFLRKFDASQLAPVLNIQAGTGGMDATGFYHVDTSIFNDGKNILEQVRDWGGELSGAPYAHLQNPSSPYQNYTLQSLLDADAPNTYSDSFFAPAVETSLRRTYDYALDTFYPALIDDSAPGLPMSCYELGAHAMDYPMLEGREDFAETVPVIDWIRAKQGEQSSAMENYRRAYINWLEEKGFRRITYYVDAGGLENFEDQNGQDWGLKADHSKAGDNEWVWVWRGSRQAVNQYIFGHSLSPKPRNGNMAALCSGLGMGLAYQGYEQVLPGAPIRAYVGSGPTFNAGNSSDGFGNGLDNGEDARTIWENDTHLSSGHYTHVIATERYDILGCLHSENTFLNMMAIYDAFTSRIPTGTFTVQSCWKDHWKEGGTSWGINDPSHFDDWVEYERQTQKIWDALVERMNLTIRARGSDNKVRMAPMSWILAEFLDKVVNGSVANLTLGTKQATLNQFFEDGVHITTPLGDYVHACMNFVCTYKRSPVGGGYQSTGDWAITQAQATAIQTLVWDVYRNYIQWHPTMAEVRDFILNSTALHDAYYAWDEVAASEFGQYGMGALFGEASYSPVDVWGSYRINPFYFDPATDAANAGFYGVP